MKSNISFLKRMTKVESHTKFDDLQSEWTNKRKLAKLVRAHSKKHVLAVTIDKHKTGGQGLRLQQGGSNLAMRNQSLSPTTMNNQMSRDISMTAEQLAYTQMKTHAQNFSPVIDEATLKTFLNSSNENATTTHSAE